MISNSAKYALKAVLYLALHSSEEKKIMAKDISASTGVPKAYLAKILQLLSRQHIISSSKGPKGGFYLSEKNKSLSLMQIIEVIDDKKRMMSCVMNLSDCNIDRPCPLHHLVDPSRSELISVLEVKTIAELVEDITHNKSFLPI